MRKDKNLAIKLRKQGLSYNQITEKIDIPKSTLSYWLRDIKLSKKAKNIIQKRVSETSIKALIKRNKQQTIIAKERADKIRKQAIKETAQLLENKLFLIGVSLYWAEGYKKGAYGSKWKSVDFSNSDPEMIRIMMIFFRNICGVKDKKIKLQLITHPNVNVNKSVNFWSKITSIPKHQFIKTCCSISKCSKGKRNKNTLENGTIHIRINDVKLFFRMIGWIDGIKKYK